MEGHHHDVGGAGRESLVSSLPRMGSEHNQNDGVGTQEQEEPQQGHQPIIGDHEKFKSKGVSAGQLHYLGYVTVKGIQGVGATEGEWKH